MRIDLNQLRDLGPLWRNLSTGEIRTITPRLGELDWIECDQVAHCMP
jgi:hypothetical protein